MALLLFGFTVPSLDGAYVDSIDKSTGIEKEIQAIRDFFTNIGYVIGPVLSGFLADKFGYAQTFAVFGLICACIILLMFLFTPKNLEAQI